MQFHIVMDVEFPDQFEKILNSLRWMKGDIIAYFNIKCAVPMNLYTEFFLVVAIIPVFVLVLLVADRASRWWETCQQNKPDKSSPETGTPATALSERLSQDLPGGETMSEDLEADNRRTTAQRMQNILSRVFIFVFLICAYTKPSKTTSHHLKQFAAHVRRSAYDAAHFSYVWLPGVHTEQR